MKYENYDLYFPDQPVVDLYLPIWANLPAFRHKPAFVWAKDGPEQLSTGTSALTYQQLNNSVQSISSRLLLPLKRGDTVVILCPPSIELVEIIFSCQRAGLLAVPLIPPHPSFTNGNHHHLVRVLSQTKPKAALAPIGYINRVREYISGSTSNSANNRFSELLRALTWIPTEELKAPKVENDVQWNISQYSGCKPDDVYLIQYTSGSTGIPKPVLVTAGSAAHNVRVARKAYDLHSNSVIVSWLPQYHDCGLMFLLLTIVSGATCVLTSPYTFINRPRMWLELITEYKATCTPVPSFTLPLVIRRGGPDKGVSPLNLGSMKNLIIINEPLYKTSVEEFVRVFRPFGLNPSSISPSYGLAENCTFVSTSWTSGNEGVNYPTYKNLLPSARLNPSRTEEEIDIFIVHEETHELVKDGTEGEIWISSPSNAHGYLDHSSLTLEVFYCRIKKFVTRCFVRTGDRGIITGQERYLFVTGRCSDIIKLESGKEIHPHFMETAAYNTCPKMLRGGCVAAFEISRTIAIVAELQKSEGESEVLKRICEGIRDGILKEERIEVNLFVVLVKSGDVPKTTSGKVQRWAAKYKFERGEMNVVMMMGFEGNRCNSSTDFSTMIVHEKKEREEGNERKKTEVGEGMFLATRNTRSHLPLLSSL